MYVDQQYNYICIAQIRLFVMLYNILVTHTDFIKSQPTVQTVQDKAGLTLWEELLWKSEEIYCPSYLVASGAQLAFRGMATRCFSQKCTQQTFANTRGWGVRVNWNMKVRLFRSN